MLTKKDFSHLSEKIDPENIRTRLADMVQIASVNPFGAAPEKGRRELELANYLTAAFEDLGLETGRSEVAPQRPNIWGTLRGESGPHIVLAAHMDTVGVEGYPEPFRPRLENGRLYGRGACDMKAAFAAYLELVRLLTEEDTALSGALTLVGLVDEEYEMIGSRAYGDVGPRADFGIIGEPTELAICPAHRGQLGFLITSHGKAAHSSRKDLGRNAIRQMMPVVNMLEAYDQALQTRVPHPLCGHASCSPNVIRGGTVASVVPETCTLEVDLRQLPGTSPETVKSELEARLKALESSVPGAVYELSGPTWDINGLEVDPASPIVQALEQGYALAFDAAPTVEAFPAATDAPYLGFPTVICGPGSLEQAHSSNEFVELQQVYDAVKLYLACLFALGARA